MKTDSSANSKEAFPRQIAAAVATATFCRILINVARRFAYPFAPVLSRGLGVPLTAVTSLIAVNQATGLLALIFGPLADRFGYRRMMTLAMAFLTVGMLAAALAPVYAVVLACLLLAGLAKNVFDPAVQAYVGERIAFGRRGFVVGVLEFSWAGSTLIGIPLIGLLIAGFGWRSPFFALALLGLIGLALLRLTVEGDKRRTPSKSSAPLGMHRAWLAVLRNKACLAAVGFAFFASVANDALFVVYGAWLEKAFALSVVALGLGTGLIGVAEFLGEVGTAALSDRLGLKTAVAGGLVLSVLSYLVLPLTTAHVGLALGGLFLVFLAFEFTMVSFLSLCTELMPGVRATVMSVVLAAAGLGRVVGALIGGPAWVYGGIEATAAVSAAFTLLALASVLWGLRGWRP
jgi:predicted MFS family arabinose efflux permease